MLNPVGRDVQSRVCNLGSPCKMPKSRKQQMKRRPRKSVSRMPSELNPSAPQFKGEAHLTLKLRNTPVLHTTTVTTGVIADAIAINPESDIQSFATRFASTFQEYRLVKARLMIRPCGSSTGVSRVWQESHNSASVTSQSASEKSGLILPNTMTNSRSVSQLIWKPRGVEVLEWSGIGSSTTFGQFSLYTDLASFNAPATATVLWETQIEYTIEFRGLVGA